MRMQVNGALGALLAVTLLVFAGTAQAQAPVDGAVPPSGASRVGLGLSNPLRTSRFDATLGLSPATFGGGSAQSSDDVRAEVVFAFVPRWSFVSTATDWAWVGARVAWSVTATGADDSTKRKAVAFEDVELDAAYNRTFARTAGGLVLLGGPRLGVAFPSSPISRASSVYVRTSLGIGADLHVPLRGGDWLPGAFVSASGIWQHAFGASQTPGFGLAVGASPPAPVGAALLDQNRFFAGASIPNGGQVSALLSAWLMIYRGLSLGSTWGFTGGYAKPLVTMPTCIQTSAGCVPLTPSSSPPILPTTVFDVALGYAIADVVWVAVGYDNTSTRVDSAGKRYGVFYSPDARLYLQVMVLADGVFAKARN